MDRNKMMKLLRQDGYGIAADYITSLERNSVSEYCANCESEIQMRWDVVADGYQAYCPICGNRLILCDECMYSNPDRSFTDRCFRKKKEEPMKIFKTKQEAKAYGENHLTKNTHELVSINGTLYILCDTNRIKESILYGNAYEMMKQFIDTFEDVLPEDVSDPHDFAPDIRDWVEGYLELLDIRFLDVYNGY